MCSRGAVSEDQTMSQRIFLKFFALIAVGTIAVIGLSGLKGSGSIAAAKNNGQTASLLNQERPNIFTQSVANILPGEQIKITISYVETLKYEDGSYEFVFPMVVGPRYVPGSPSGAQGDGFAPDTERVPDGSRITPQPAPEGMRAGHDVSIDL